jgi:hypothetical protein
MKDDQHDSNDDIDAELLQALQSLPKLHAPTSLHAKLMQIPEQYEQKNLLTGGMRPINSLALAWQPPLLCSFI